MDNLVIDDEIINAYLNGEDLSKFKDLNYYEFYYEGKKTDQLTFTPPSADYLDRASRVTKEVKDLLLNFNIHSETQVDSFLGELDDWTKNIKIALVVGLPLRYMRLLKHDEETNITTIVIDIVNSMNQFEDDNLFYEDFMNYLKYAICNLLIDEQLDLKTEDLSVFFSYELYIASFADYMAGSHQTALYEQIPFMKSVIYDEYRAIYHAIHHHEKQVEKYLMFILGVNPEMIAVASTGKHYLENLSLDEAVKVYKAGPDAFIKCLYDEMHIKTMMLMPVLYKIANYWMLTLGIIYAIWTGLVLYNNFLIQIYLFYPFVLAISALLRELLLYKMNLNTVKSFFIKAGLIAVVALIYLFIIF